MSMTPIQAKELGAVVARARARKGLSYRALAAQLGVAVGWLVELEAGTYTDPAPERLARLADALDIDPKRIDRLSRGAVTDGLPEPRVYFRAKLGLTNDEAERVRRYIERLRSGMTALAGALIADSDVLSLLRALQPDRALSWTEAHSVAERQATLLLDLLHITEPPVPQFVITSLPGIFVEWRADWPAEATSFHTGTHWHIVVRATDHRQRQRFSLGHEFKHVIDDPVCERLFQHLPAEERHDRAERLCNYFAACLLMPRPWLKHDWFGGLQTPYKLARRYYVSTRAMNTRLSELGLTPMTLAVQRRLGWRHHEAQ